MTAPPITVDSLEDGHALLLGTTGSGKTYQLRGLVEMLRAADRRVGCIDKLGNHWGLTLARDGKSPGLDLVIFGGKRAQVPMTPADGEKLGELFVARQIPAIFDLSQWKADEQERWVAGFADAVFRANEGALHLTFDEAQSWVPQGGGGEAFRSVQRLAEQGRGNGIRLLLSCQRLSRLDATVRAMAHLVVAMRQTSPLDRRAVRDLVAADAEQAARLEAELPGLPVGTAFVWTAGAVDLARVAFGENATFDSSRTPRHGDSPPAPVATSSGLVEEMRAALAGPAEEPHPDDVIPADGEAAYRKGSAVGQAIAARDRRIAELDDDVDNLTTRIAELQRENRRFADGWTAMAELLASIYEGSALFEEEGQSNVPSPADDAETGTRDQRANAPLAGPSTDPPDTRVRGHKPLAALAAVHPARLTEAQWATLAGYARTGGTWGTYKSALRAAGLIEEDAAGTWCATPEGLAAAGVAPEPLPPPGPDRAAFWGGIVPGARKLVAVLTKRWPHFTTRESLASDVGMAASGGTFGTYLGRLRANALIEEKGKRLRLAAGVMGDAE